MVAKKVSPLMSPIDIIARLAHLMPTYEFPLLFTLHHRPYCIGGARNFIPGVHGCKTNITYIGNKLLIMLVR